MWVKLSRQERFVVIDAPSVASYAMSAPPPPPKGKGKQGLAGATDALRTMAGVKTSADEAAAVEAAQKARTLKRRAEDGLPDFDAKNHGLAAVLLKNNISEYFPVALTQYGRNAFSAILSAMVSSAKFGVNRTIPFVYAMMDYLAIIAAMAHQYASDVTLQTMEFVAGDHTGYPTATEKGDYATAFHNARVSMTQVNSWGLRVIGTSQDTLGNRTCPWYNFPRFQNAADPRVAGTVFDSTVQTYDGCLQFAASYAGFAETHLTEVEVQLLILLWFIGADFAAAVTLIIAMCFGAGRAGEAALQRRFATFHYAYTEPLPNGADAFIGTLVGDLPSIDNFIAAVYRHPAQAGIILLTTTQFRSSPRN